MAQIFRQAPNKLHKHALTVLTYLQDNKWKMQVCQNGVGIGTIESLVEQKMITMKPIVKKGEQIIAEGTNSTICDIDDVDWFQVEYDQSKSRNGFIGSYKITKHGLNVLNKHLLS